MQDEPELGAGFSYKMSLKERIGMLGIDHQHGRFGSDKPGTDSGVCGGQRRRDGVEAVTDDLAAGPWLALDDGQSLSEAVEVLDRLLAA